MNLRQRIYNFFGAKQNIVVEKSFDLGDVNSSYINFRTNSFSYLELTKQYKNLAYSCINLRAHSTAVCEPFVLQETNQSDVKELDNHSLADVFNNPNPDMSYYDLLFETIKNLDLFGKCYWYAVRNNFGEPVEFYILPTNSIKKVLKNGLIDYYSYSKNGKEIRYSKDEIIHFKYDESEKGIIEAGQVIFQIENAISNYQKRYFDNDAQPHFVLTTDSKLSEVEFRRFIESFNKRYSGEDNANKTMVLTQGFKPNLLSANPKETDYVNTWRTIQTRILSLFGVHPALVGIIEDVNRANAIEAQTIFTDRTIAPIVKRIDTTITRFIRKAYDDLSLKVYHKIEQPSDRKLQLEEMKVALQYNKITTNEFRSWLGDYDSIKNGDRLV